MSPFRASPRLRARLELLGAALLFSTGGAAVKAVALGGWPVAAGRSLVAAVALGLLLPGLWRRTRRGEVLVAVPYAATLLLFVLANKLTTAANAIFLQSTAPLYLLLLAPLWLKEAIRGRDVLFMAALAAGLALFFVGQEGPQHKAPEPALGNLLAAASGLAWAFTVAGLRLLARDTPAGPAAAGAALRAAFWGNVLVALVALPVALARPLGAAGPADGLWLLYLGTVQIALAYLLVTRGVRFVPALEGALLLLVEPVLSTLWAWALHGEVPGAFAGAGAVVILAATVLHTLATARRARIAPTPGRPAGE